MNWDRLSPAESLAILRATVHENCEPPWYCQRCGFEVCPRCEVSPGEPELCALCWQSTADDGSAA